MSRKRFTRSVWKVFERDILPTRKFLFSFNYGTSLCDVTVVGWTVRRQSYRLVSHIAPPIPILVTFSTICVRFKTFGAGVSGNSRLPYKFLRNSQEFIRQTGIPAHPCFGGTKANFHFTLFCSCLSAFLLFVTKTVSS